MTAMLEQPSPRRVRSVARAQVVASLLTALALVGAAVPARAQRVAQQLAMDGPALTPPESAPVEPLPSATAPTSPTPGPPGAVTLPPPTLTAAPAPGAPSTAADSPIYERWWFWTAIAAFAVTAVVIVAASSGPSAPRTDLGNMPAF
jgi:hypothetical protein